jgi:hypothetical protein
MVSFCKLIESVCQFDFAFANAETPKKLSDKIDAKK